MADVQETVLRFYADGHREWFGRHRPSNVTAKLTAETAHHPPPNRPTTRQKLTARLTPASQLTPESP